MEKENMKKDIVKVIGTKGCGSTVAEAFLILGEIPYEREEVDYSAEGPAKDRLIALNPLGQVPTLLLPDGTILTETLAIMAYVQSINPAAGLVPSDTKKVAKFWRWAVFLVAAIYPTFTYGDMPEKWVNHDKAAPLLKESTDQWRQFLWINFEMEAGEPYFLGDTMSAIDIYLCCMTHWRPGREWFEKNCPRIASIAKRLDKHPNLAALWNKNF